MDVSCCTDGKKYYLIWYCALGYLHYRPRMIRFPLPDLESRLEPFTLFMLDDPHRPIMVNSPYKLKPFLFCSLRPPALPAVASGKTWDSPQVGSSPLDSGRVTSCAETPTVRVRSSVMGTSWVSCKFFAELARFIHPQTCKPPAAENLALSLTLATLQLRLSFRYLMTACSSLGSTLLSCNASVSGTVPVTS